MVISFFAAKFNKIVLVILMLNNNNNILMLTIVTISQVKLTLFLKVEIDLIEGI